MAKNAKPMGHPTERVAKCPGLVSASMGKSNKSPLVIQSLLPGSYIACYRKTKAGFGDLLPLSCSACCDPSSKLDGTGPHVVRKGSLQDRSRSTTDAKNQLGVQEGGLSTGRSANCIGGYPGLTSHSHGGMDDLGGPFSILASYVDSDGVHAA
jgi:hypothetical protein